MSFNKKLCKIEIERGKWKPYFCKCCRAGWKEDCENKRLIQKKEVFKNDKGD